MFSSKCIQKTNPIGSKELKCTFGRANTNSDSAKDVFHHQSFGLNIDLLDLPRFPQAKVDKVLPFCLENNTAVDNNSVFPKPVTVKEYFKKAYRSADALSAVGTVLLVRDLYFTAPLHLISGALAVYNQIRNEKGYNYNNTLHSLKAKERTLSHKALNLITSPGAYRTMQSAFYFLNVIEALSKKEWIKAGALMLFTLGSVAVARDLNKGILTKDWESFRVGRVVSKCWAKLTSVCNSININPAVTWGFGETLYSYINLKPVLTNFNWLATPLAGLGMVLGPIILLKGYWDQKRSQSNKDTRVAQMQMLGIQCLLVAGTILISENYLTAIAYGLFGKVCFIMAEDKKKEANKLGS